MPAGKALRWANLLPPIQRYGDFKNLRINLNISSNATLKQWSQCETAISFLKSFNLRLHPDPPKNWDALGALNTVLNYTSPDCNILDAGGEYYSSILPMLRQCGYQNLFAVNLNFESENIEKNKIHFIKGDITKTAFQDESLDAIICLSVIEHGVNLTAYFKEMSRILKPHGLLFTSTDYWFVPINTGHQTAYGMPVKIFCEREIIECIEVARQNNLALIDSLDLRCVNKVVHWKEFDLTYTFTYFTLKKLTSK